ncbi:MAG: response regulator transcription factor [Bacteroidia bacterium]
MEGLTIIHADSRPLARQGLKAVLSKGGGISFIRQIPDISQLMKEIGAAMPALLIMDYQQPPHFTMDDLLRIRSKFPNLKMLVISADDNQDSIMRVLEAGVSGYLTFTCDEEEIINAVFSIAKGQKFYCNKIINILMERSFSPQEEDNCAPTSLTEREIEVTRLIAKGFTNKDIARHLFLSIHTVSTHRKNILKKLQIRSASALVMYAVNAGIVKPEDIEAPEQH